MPLQHITIEEAQTMPPNALLELGRFQRRNLALKLGVALSIDALAAFLTLDDKQQVTEIQSGLRFYKEHPEAAPYITAYAKAFEENMHFQKRIRDLEAQVQKLEEQTKKVNEKTKKKKKKKVVRE